MDIEGDVIQITIDERGIRALSAAVDYTLEKWSGQGYMDQEELLALKPFLKAALWNLSSIASILSRFIL